MATAGTALYPSSTTYPSATTYPGGGDNPILWCLYSTDAVSTAVPTWLDATLDVRSFSVSRGRASELSRVDAGTASILLDNRDRAYDPVITTAIRPLNRWWIREQFSGDTIDVFKGYAESYQQQWVKGSDDASTVVSCVDEFKVLALNKLPTTDPPRPTYQELVMFDEPTGYWPMDGSAGQVAAVVGESLTAVNGGAVDLEAEGGIVGQVGPRFSYLTGTAYLQTGVLTTGMSGDAGALAEFTIETWFSRIVTALPSSTELLIKGPDGTPSTTYTWKMSFNTTGQIVLEVKNSGGTVHTCTSSTALSSIRFHHIVGTITGGSLRLYINGTQEAATAWTGTIEQCAAGFTMIVGNAGTDISTKRRAFDEMAFYRVGLSAARVLAHYTAGASRGFQEGTDTGGRISNVLTAIGNSASVSIGAGTRNMLGNYMVGQPPLDEMRRAETAEGVDAVLFIAKDGTITFLPDGHRSGAPWNTVQATFDDDGTDLPYQDIGLDYSDSFITNEWNVTRTGGLLQTVSDATSITKFFKRSQSLTDISITGDAGALAIATAMLAKYKDPMTRITSLTLQTTTVAVLDNIFRRDIGDCIRVLRTPPGGGARIDQTVFIQHISIDAQPGTPWRVVWGLSPL